MSTIEYRATQDLEEGDVLLVGASTISVDSVAPDEFDDDECWLRATCCSGNFDQWDGVPHRCRRDAIWTVLA